MSANCRPKYHGRLKHCVFRNVAQNAACKLVWLLNTGHKLSFEMPKNSCLLEISNVKNSETRFCYRKRFRDLWACANPFWDTFEMLSRVNNLSWCKYILRPRLCRSFTMTAMFHLSINLAGSDVIAISSIFLLQSGLFRRQHVCSLWYHLDKLSISVLKNWWISKSTKLRKNLKLIYQFIANYYKLRCFSCSQQFREMQMSRISRCFSYAFNQAWFNVTASE